MPTNNQSVVELILRARVEAQQTVQQLSETIDELTDNQRSLTDAFADSSTRLNKLKSEYKSLSDAATSLRRQGKLVQSFREQKKATDAARKSWQDATAEATRLATTISQVGVPTREMLRNFQGTVVAARRSKEEFTRQSSVLNNLRSRLSSVGVQSTRLGDAQKQLTSNARRVRGELDRVEKEMRDIDGASRRASRSVAAFGRSGATSIPGLARLRSEVGLLLTTYLGFRGLTNVTRAVFDVNRTLETARANLRVGLGGDDNAVAEEMRFVREEADRLKLSFPVLIREYSKFASATKGTKIENEELRIIFSGVAEAARVNRASVDDLAGVFRALTQVASKGKVQAEELRGQLGDRFPGAVQIMATALGVTNEQLEQMLENGQITSDALVHFGAQLSKRFGDELPKSLQSSDAALGEFQNVIFDLNREIADSGFLDALTEGLRDITEEMKSPEFKAGARTLGRALSALARAIVFVVQHMEEFIAVAGVLFGLRILGGAATTIGAISSAVVRLGSLMRGLIPILVRLKAFFGPAGAFAGGFAIGTILRDQFAEVRAFGVALIAGFNRAFIDIRAIVKKGALYFKQDWETQLKAVANKFIEDFAQIYDYIATAADAVGLDKLRDSLQGAADLLRSGKFDNTEFQKGLQAITDEAEKAKLAVDDLAATQFADAFKAPDSPVKPEDSVVAPIAKEPINLDPFQIPEVVSKEQEKLAKRLAQIDREIAEAQADTLQERLALIRSEYADLLEELAEQANYAGIGQVQTLIAIREEQEAQRFRLEELRAAEERVNEALSIRQQLMENIARQQELGLLTQTEAQQRVIELNEQTIPQLEKMVEEARKLAAALGDQNSLANLKAVQLQLKETSDNIVITGDQVNNAFANSFVDAFDQAAQGILSVRDAFKQFATDFLREISRMILQQTVLNALQAAGFGGTVAGTVNAPLNHSGGIVGQTSLQRTVASSLFAGAPRYHNGGLAGLSPNEVPSILKRGEEVLTRNDPRHILNNGGGQNVSKNYARFYFLQDRDELAQHLAKHPAMEKAVVAIAGENGRSIQAEW